MNACMYVCINACMCVCIDACLHVCMYVCMYVVVLVGFFGQLMKMCFRTSLVDIKKSVQK